MWNTDWKLWWYCCVAILYMLFDLISNLFGSDGCGVVDKNDTEWRGSAWMSWTRKKHASDIIGFLLPPPDRLDQISSVLVRSPRPFEAVDHAVRWSILPSRTVQFRPINPTSWRTALVVHCECDVCERVAYEWIVECFGCFFLDHCWCLCGQMAKR